MPEDGLQFTGKSYDNTGGLGPTRGATSPSSSSGSRPPPGADSHGRRAARAAGAGRPARRGREGMRWLMASDVCKHCTTPPVWRCVPPGRCSGLSSGRWWSRRTCATVAATASPPVRSACLVSASGADGGGCGSAPCAMTGSRTTRSPPAPRRAPPSRSSSGRWRYCAHGRRPPRPCRSRRGRRPALRRDDPTASAALAPSFCCWTSPRPTACLRIRWYHAGCRSMWRRGRRRGAPRVGLLGGRRTLRPALGPARPRRAASQRPALRRRPAPLRRGWSATRSYYGKPIIAEPVWELGDPALLLHRRSRRRVGHARRRAAAGNRTLARHAAGLAVAPVGQPAAADLRPRAARRFLNMLRMVKVSSPMSMGTWLLSAPAARPRWPRTTCSGWFGPASGERPPRPRPRARPTAQHLHRGAHRRHRGAGLA